MLRSQQILDQSCDNPKHSASPSATRAARSDVKKAARSRDRARLQNGESPQQIQGENSIFPSGFFKGARISNLHAVIGR